VKKVIAAYAEANLDRLIELTKASHEPILITGKHRSAVLLSEDDWNGINETLYLLSGPSIRQSIVEGMQESIDQCAETLKW